LIAEIHSSYLTDSGNRKKESQTLWKQETCPFHPITPPLPPHLHEGSKNLFRPNKEMKKHCDTERTMPQHDKHTPLQPDKSLTDGDL